MTMDDKEKRRQLETERGQFVLAKKFFAREFDPDYRDENEGPKISAAERLRRDEYRNRMQAQVKK